MVDPRERVGQKIGDYQLLRPLGQGTFGTVYLAEHIYDASRVAVKLLHLQLAGHDDFRIFLNEARTIRLQHPHIVPIFDFGLSQDNLPFLVMGYAAGGTVRDCYPKGTKLPWPVIDAYVQAISSALQYAHDRRIVHRDVKPENMLVCHDGNIQLSDFGIARMVEQNTASASSRGQIGTPAYMAPEQSQGKPCPASDQYALAVTVYEWFTGQRPFQGGPLEVLLQHRVDAPPPMRKFCPEVPQQIERILFKALEKAPEARFPTIEQFAQALHGTLQWVLTSTPFAPSAGEYATMPASDHMPVVAPLRSNRVEETIIPSRGVEATPESSLLAHETSFSQQAEMSGIGQPRSHRPNDTAFPQPSSLLSVPRTQIEFEGEQASDAKQPPKSPGGRGKGRMILVTLICIALVGIALGPLLMLTHIYAFQSITAQSSSTPVVQQQKPTAIPTPQPTQPPDEVYKRYITDHPTQTDALLNDPNWQWTNSGARYGECSFSQGAFHVTPHPGSFASCVASTQRFTTFAFQVDVSIQNGDAAGLIVNDQPTTPYRTYDAFVYCRDTGKYCTNGGVWFTHAHDGGANCVTGFDCNKTYPTFINTTLGGKNTLTAIVLSNAIYLYINGHPVGVSLHSSAEVGGIGVVAFEDASPTDATFQNAKLWKIAA
jgi:serine/threonine protein kinase